MDILEACLDINRVPSEDEMVRLLVDASTEETPDRQIQRRKPDGTRTPFSEMSQNFRMDETDKTKKTKDKGSFGRATTIFDYGDITRLLKVLRNELVGYLTHQHAGFKADRKAARLPLCVLCVGMENATRLYEDVLLEDLKDCRNDVSFCLPKLLEIVFSWKDDDTIRLPAVTALTKTVSRLAPHVPRSLASFGVSLLQGFRSDLPDFLKVEVACKLVDMLRVKTDLEQRTIVIRQIEANQGVIVSVLSSACMSSRSDAMSMLGSLILLTQVMEKKVRKRRCVVLAACKQLQSEQQDARLEALSLCKFFFEARECDDAGVYAQNSVLAAKSLRQLLLQSDDDKTLLQALSVATVATSCKILDEKYKDQLMQSVLELAKNATRDDFLTTTASLLYLKSASRAEGRLEVLTNTVGFLSSPHRSVRQASLLLLKDISYWNPRSLMHESLGCLEKLADVVTEGNHDDCSEALQVVRQLSSEDPALLCRKRNLLSAIVRLVTTEPIANRSAYINGCMVLLALMSEDTNMSAFLCFDSLLPWLIDLANRTVDDTMKQQLVSVIIRYTMAKLDEISPTKAAF